MVENSEMESFKRNLLETSSQQEDELPHPKQELVENLEKGDDTSQDEHHLDRSLTKLNGFTMMVGIFVGSGVFVSPGLVVKRTPNLAIALLIWIVGGFITIMGSCVYLELGGLFPKPGSQYIYIFRTIGRVPAFVYIWSYVTIAAPSGTAVLVNTLGTYACQPFFEHLDSWEAIWTSKLVAVLVILILSVINTLGIRLSAYFQYIFTGAQVLIVLIVIGVAGWRISVTGDFSSFHADNFFANSSHVTNWDQMTSIGTAMFNALFAYDGWALMGSFTEELIEPEKSLPIIAFSSTSFTICLYALLNLAYFTVLTRSEMTSTSAVAITMVAKVAGKTASSIMPVLVAVVIIGTVNSNMVGMTRIYLSAARKNHLPHVFSLIHRGRKSPVPAIWLLSATTIFWLFAVNRTEDLIQYYSSSVWVFYGMAMIGCIRHRFHAKDEYRPYRVTLSTPIFMVVVAVILVTLACASNWIGASLGWTWIFCSLPVYYVVIHKQFITIKLLGKINKLIQRKFNLVGCN